jgi:galactokinase
MTGGGFGGCTVSLVELDAVETLRGRVESEYASRTGRTPRLWITRAVDGAGFVDD